MPGTLLVALQIALIVALVAPWSAATLHGWGMALIAPATALGLWTLSVNRPGNFSIFPQPRQNARLITTGPYRHVRHPMYLALLLFTLGCALLWLTPVHLIAWPALALVLHAKAGIEERALLERFPGYRDYCARTPRIVPFLR